MCVLLDGTGRKGNGAAAGVLFPTVGCNCKCSADDMTSVEQGRVVTIYLCLLMFVMVSMRTAFAPV